jgi:hypothetical protein
MGIGSTSAGSSFLGFPTPRVNLHAVIRSASWASEGLWAGVLESLTPSHRRGSGKSCRGSARTGQWRKSAISPDQEWRTIAGEADLIQRHPFNERIILWALFRFGCVRGPAGLKGRRSPSRGPVRD